LSKIGAGIGVPIIGEAQVGVIISLYGGKLSAELYSATTDRSRSVCDIVA
jgi:hypothetical protein